MWDQLPRDITSQILHNLAVPDIVRARQVSNHWASTARETSLLEMLLEVSKDDLTISQAGFAAPALQLQDHKNSFLIRVTNILSLRMLESFMLQLQSQVSDTANTWQRSLSPWFLTRQHDAGYSKRTMQSLRHPAQLLFYTLARSLHMF